MNILLKAKYSFYSAIVFFLVANPETYRIVNHFLSPFIGQTASGLCPTPFGVIVHTILFFCAMLALMMFPRL